MERDYERVYFVTETKGTDDLYDDSSITPDERGKILSGREHFAEIGVEYLAPVKDFQSVKRMVVSGE